MKVSEWGLLITLLAGTFYNVDNTLIRLLLMLTWAFLPIVLMFHYNRIPVGLKGLGELNSSLFIITLLFVCFIVNIDTLSFQINGPNVEKMTPFLYLFHVTALFYFLQLNHNKINEKFVFKFMLFVVIILLLDMIVRYIQAPQYFLNYTTRHQAKTIGFFSTTNVNGQIIAFLLAISWQIKFKYKKLIQITLLVILITTMARSAIVTVIVVFGLSYLIYNKGLLSRFISIFLVTSIIILFIIDPLGFRYDGSLMSKIQFFQATFNLIETGTWKDIIFGYGASFEAITAALNVNGWSPHVSILKAFLYYGLLGVFIFVYILFHFYKEDKRMLLPILAFLIFSMAGAPIFWPTFSVGLILFKIYSNLERNRLYDK